MHRLPPRPGPYAGLGACLGIFFGISVLAFSSFDLHVMLALGSFGSTSVLLFAFPDNHFSQPRSIVGGHLISSVVGLVAFALFGKVWWGLGLAVAGAAALMMVTRTMHPPAGSNPIIVFLTAPGWGFALFPTLFGAMALVAAGWCYHRVRRQPYPLYWTGGESPVIASQTPGYLGTDSSGEGARF
jgi:CBS-domain-containing membrane protein